MMVLPSSPYPISRELAQVSISDEDVNNPEIVTEGYEPYYYTQSLLSNDLESEDLGMEFFMNFPNLLKNLSLDVQSSYTYTYDIDKANVYERSSSASTAEKFGIYHSPDKERSRLQLGANLSYHLAKIGLVVDIRSEHFIFYKSETKGRGSPYAFVNENLKEVIIPQADRNDENLYGHIIKPQYPYIIERTQVYHNFHLRISKDFLNGFRFSFYANNFLDLKPTTTESDGNQVMKRRNTDIVSLAFGTKIEYQF